MRVHYVLLLAAGAFFASAEVDPVGASTADRLAIAEKNAESVSRSLRTAAAANGEGSIPRIIKHHPDHYFEQLELNKMKKFDELLGDPRFSKWLQHVKNTVKTDPYGAAANTLARYFPKVEDLRKVVSRLEADSANLRHGNSNAHLQPRHVDFRSVLYHLSSPNAHSHQLLTDGLKKHGDKGFAGAIEQARIHNDGNILASIMQLTHFQDLAKRSFGPVKAFDLFCRENGAIIGNKLYHEVWLKYVEHLISMKSQMAEIEHNSNDVLLAQLIESARDPSSSTTGEEQLIKRWVQEELHPEGVSWVLGAKALEEGTQEHEFLTAYKTAFNKKPKSALEAANDPHPSSIGIEAEH